MAAIADSRWKTVDLSPRHVELQTRLQKIIASKRRMARWSMLIVPWDIDRNWDFVIALNIFKLLLVSPIFIGVFACKTHSSFPGSQYEVSRFKHGRIQITKKLGIWFFHGSIILQEAGALAPIHSSWSSGETTWFTTVADQRPMWYHCGSWTALNHIQGSRSWSPPKDGERKHRKRKISRSNVCVCLFQCDLFGGSMNF